MSHPNFCVHLGKKRNWNWTCILQNYLEVAKTMVSQHYEENPLEEPNASFLDWLSRVTYIFPEGEHRFGRSVYIVVPAHAFFFYLFYEEVRHNLNNFEDLADMLQFFCVFSITWHKWMVMLAKPRLFMKLAATVENNFGMPEQTIDPTYSVILKKYWNEHKVFRILWIIILAVPAMGVAVLPAIKILRMQNSCRNYNATGNETVPMEHDVPSFPFHNWTPYDEFVNDVESFAHPVLLNQFGSSSIICCMAAFNVALNPSLEVRILICACVFGAAVFELGVYCAVGDHLMDQSLQVDFAAYSSEWYRSSIRIRRDISIIKMRATRCAKITFGKFSPLNLKSYASIMHVIYSYYTMLTGVNKTGRI